jgi:AcrR family transcriptional regulator
MPTIKKRDTSSAILNAAFTQLIEQGAEGFSVRKVAQRANVSLGNLQYHFATKNDLISALFGSISERVALAAGEKATEEAQIFAFIDAIFNELDTPQGSIPVWELCAMAAHDRKLAEMLHQMFAPFRHRISRLISTTNPGRSQRTCDHQATCIVALIEGTGWFDANSRHNRTEFRGLRAQARETIKLIIHSKDST